VRGVNARRRGRRPGRSEAKSIDDAELPRKATSLMRTGELFPRVGFVVTNLRLPSRVVCGSIFGAARPNIGSRNAEQAAHWTRLSCHLFRANAVAIERARLQPRQLVEAAGTAKADRHLVAHQLAAAPRQDWRALDQACAVLLAPVGGESPDTTPIRSDAAANLGAGGPDGLTGKVERRDPKKTQQGTTKSPATAGCVRGCGIVRIRTAKMELRDR